MSSPLRVLAISHSAVNRTSGRLRYEVLAERNPQIHLTVIAPDRWEEYGKVMKLDPHDGPLDFRTEKVRLQSLPKVGWYLHHYPGLRRLLRDIRPDVIAAWEEPWSLAALQVVRLRDALLPDAAVIVETDQNILRRLPPPFQQIRRYTLKRADMLVARQQAGIGVMRGCGYEGPAKIVEYGVAGTVFQPMDRAASREALGVSGFVIGYVGRIVREKGLHDAVSAIASCKTAVTMLVMGRGPDRAALEAHAAASGVADRVRIIDPGEPEAVARMMNGLDALVLLSRTTRTWKEQFGRVIMEALTCGVPVIGSDSGAIPAVIADGGWVVPEGDVAALASLLDHLADNPDEMRQAGAAGMARARHRFAITTIADDLAEAIIGAKAHRDAIRGATSHRDAIRSQHG